jgi:hypothetical protein
MTGLGCEFRSDYKCKRFAASSVVRNFCFCGRGGFMQKHVLPKDYSRSQKRQLMKAARRFNVKLP